MTLQQTAAAILVPEGSLLLGAAAAAELHRSARKVTRMPVISMFYGIIVSLYFQDNRRHHRPHIHAKYQDDEAVIAIPDGEVLEGSLPPGKLKMVLAWVEIHRDDLMADWELAVNGQQPFRVEPLR